jgi:hypothetical protein
MITAALMLVLFRGGDALSICFNTIALLFMCEIDNLGYAILLGESMRARVELEGRTDLGEAEWTSLMCSKVVHIVALLLAVPSAVAFAASGNEEVLSSTWLLPRFAFLLAGVTEASELRTRRLKAMTRVFAYV